MLATVALALAAASLVSAQVTPTGPAPGADFQEGGPCLITWNADTTGTWKTAYIQFMSGDNINMHHLTTVTSFDGTDPSVTSHTWTCPKVTLHSAVYFYQFTSAGSDSPQWTGRFSVSNNGDLVAPPNSTQPDGSAHPWGDGKLVDSSTATPPPPTSPQFISASGSASSTSTGTSSSSTAVSSSSTPVSSTTTVSRTTGTSSSTGTSSTGTTTASGAGSTTTGAALANIASPAGIFAAALGAGLMAFF